MLDLLTDWLSMYIAVSTSSSTWDSKDPERKKIRTWKILGEDKMQIVKVQLKYCGPWWNLCDITETCKVLRAAADHSNKGQSHRVI